jgi:hypothetical protein
MQKKRNKVKTGSFPYAIFSKNHKGLSTIVVTLILIVISLVAIGAVWLVVSNILKGNSNQIGTSGLTLSMDIEHVYQNNNSLSVGVVRNVGEGTVTKIQFIFSDGVNSVAVIRDVNLSELQAQNFVFQTSEINLSSVKSISIAPYYVANNGNELLGSVKDTYSVGSNQSNYPNNSCTPSTCASLGGYNCDNWSDGCGGILNCGTCNGTQICSGGHCYGTGYNCSLSYNYSCYGNASVWANECGNYTTIFCNSTQTCISNATRCKTATCFDKGYNCGTYNGYYCGGCSSGYICTNLAGGVCISNSTNCSLTTYSYLCSGSISTRINGCGVYNNQSCSSNQVCITNITRCRNLTCSEKGYTCGTYNSFNCGTCNSGYYCNRTIGGGSCIYNNTCIISNYTYHCFGANVNTRLDNCGNDQNQSCSSNQVCITNITRCRSKTCSEAGYNCGTYNSFNCGTCGTGYTCSNSAGGTCQAVSTGNGLIIDHTNTNLSKIPSYWIEQAKRLTFQYAHRSDGNNILEGLGYLYNINSNLVFSSAINSLPSQTNPIRMRIMDGNPPTDSYSTPDLYWSTASGRSATVNNWDSMQFNYSMWSWCDELTYYSTSDTQAYLNTMSGLEANHPNQKFIYMTSYTENSDPQTVANNQLIRNYVIANNKTLYDFEDIGKYDPNGVYYPNADRACTWCTSWCNSHPSDCTNLPSCSHAGYLGAFVCVQRGKAFWWMMARLAGWNGVSTS